MSELSSSTAMSANYDMTILSDIGVDTKHVINTAKVVRGHKLTMKDYIKIQNLKNKRVSPTKCDTFDEFSESRFPTPRRKYSPNLVN